MVFIVSFLSIFVLIVLHELGHFFFAKKFGVRVEEFAVGFPPKIFGKQWGETLVSLNLLPLGAFVRLTGEEKAVGDPRSYSQKPYWQRALIIGGGVAMFWLVSIAILTILGSTSGIPMAVPDDFSQAGASPSIQITAIAPGSPAEDAGLKPGDTVRIVRDPATNHEETIQSVSQLQAFIQDSKGKEVVLKVAHGKEEREVSVTPLASPPEGRGPLGVILARTAFVTFPWYEAPLKAVLLSAQLSYTIVQQLFLTLSSFFAEHNLPAGVQFVGPIGIFGMLSNSFELGIPYFFYLVSMISLYLAVFNALPIPAVDGGKLLFLGIEALRKKPLPEKLETRLTAIFFGTLLLILILVTIGDIKRLFI
ncbi:MAG: M50 family metallopeptidase [bacterium]|nr:M50 family metallopeptidase [bacterium]